MSKFCESPVLTNYDCGKYFLNSLFVYYLMYYFLQIKKYFNIPFSWFFIANFYFIYFCIHIFYIIKCGFFTYFENIFKN